ncbi:MAG: VOC family protein, partial [Halanaeroarchaeum sp.]
EYEEKYRDDVDGTTTVGLCPESMHEDGALLELVPSESGEPELGDAWGHIAVRVPEGDLEAAYQGLVDGGVGDYRDPESCGGRYAFVKDPDGHEIEIVTRDHGTRWSIDHTMIRVEDAEAAIGFWTRAFEYDAVGRWEADTFANYFLEPGDAAPAAMAVELTYNYDGRTYDAGDGWGHLGVRVDDLHSDWETVQTREAPSLRDPDSCAGRRALTKDRDGHEIELVTRDPGATSSPY